MRTPGLWASMRGIWNALRSFGEGDSSRIRGLATSWGSSCATRSVRAEAARPLSSPLTPEIEEELV